MSGGGPGCGRSARIAVLNSSAQTAVVCDTTAYLPTALAAERGIETISLYVSVDGEQERESEIDDYAAFYEKLRASEGGATTSQPSIGDFLAVYEPLLEAGREIVSIHISAGISGTFEAAGQARQRLIDEGKGGERILLMDSRSAAGGMGLCALGASVAALNGGRRRRRPRPGRAHPRRAEDVVRDRHPRVPAPRRPDRRRPRLDRQRPEDQADPHPRGGDHPGRAGPHPRPLGRAPARLRPPAARLRPRRLGRPAHPGRRDRRPPWPTTAARSSAASRSSSPRSAPSSAPTSAPACSASAASRPSWSVPELGASGGGAALRGRRSQIQPRRRR